MLSITKYCWYSITLEHLFHVNIASSCQRSGLSLDDNLLFHCVLFLCGTRWIYSNDGSFSLEEKNWLFCHSDLPPLYHDCHSVSSVILAEQRICTCQDSLWWVYWLALALFAIAEDAKKYLWSKGLIHSS